MPSLTPQPIARTIHQILSGPDYFRIPRFQRPFSWDVEHVDDFWQDAIANADNGYFIGPMVVYRDDNLNWGIVDGQQRLTVITLILAAIRDNFAALNVPDLAGATHRFVERPDTDGKQRFVLQSDVGEGRWIHSVQQQREANEPLNKSDFDSDAWSAVALVSRNLSQLVEDSNATSNKAKVNLLRQIRDKVLNLSVIWVPLEQEDDAYEIFETLNARGKDLEVSDRLKNLFLNYLRAANVNLDDHRRRWNLIREQFEGEPSSRDLNRFILHWWLSRAQYVAERKVFRAIKTSVDRSRAATEFDEFEADAKRYRSIVDPSSVVWTIERRPIQDSLLGFRVMNLSQPMPFVLAAVRAYDEKKLSLKRVIDVLQLIENYHFQVTAISTKSSSGGISEMYASHARQLTDARTKPDCNDQLKALADKLIDRAPSRNDFVEAFVSRFALTDEYGRDKRLVQYVLERIHGHSNPSPPVDYAKCTIEHILPQSKASEEIDRSVVGGIGNLCLVDESLNNRLGDKKFDDKRRILKPEAAKYGLDDVVDSATWGPTEIDSRARTLADLAYRKVWRVARRR